MYMIHLQHTHIQWNLRIMDTVGMSILFIVQRLSLRAEMYGQLMAGGKQFVHCREVVLLLECPLIRGFTVVTQCNKELTYKTHIAT